MKSLDRMEFTSDWCSRHFPKWQELTADFAGDQGIMGLEIGVYEGRSVKWWLENVFTDPTSLLIGVDPVPDRFEHNLDCIESDPDVRCRFEFMPCSGQDAMVRLLSRRGLKGRMHMIYLDGGKEACTILETATLAWQLLRKGGVLIFDDYQWQWNPETSIQRKPEKPPKVGIDAFLDANAHRLEILHSDWQVAVRKL